MILYVCVCVRVHGTVNSGKTLRRDFHSNDDVGDTYGVGVFLRVGGGGCVVDDAGDDELGGPRDRGVGREQHDREAFHLQICQ